MKQEAQKIEHTPLPWTRESLVDVSEEDASFILRACNGYYEDKHRIRMLISCLEAAQKFIRIDKGFYETMMNAEITKVIAKAKEVI